MLCKKMLNIKTIRIYHYNANITVTIWGIAFQVSRLLCGCCITDSLYTRFLCFRKDGIYI